MKSFRLFLSFCFLVLVSCTSKSELDGVWIGAYEINYYDGKPMNSSLNLLLDFENGSLTQKSFSDIGNNFKAHVKKSKFVQKGDLILVKSEKRRDTFKLLSVNKDSLMLSINTPYNNQRKDFVFKNITPQKSPDTINLTNRAFQIETKDKIWLMDFINDSLILDSEAERLMPWKIEKYKDKSFLLFDVFSVIPLFISETEQGEIVLTQFNTGPQDVSLTKVPKKYEKKKILGNWTWVKNSAHKDNTNESLLPPPLPPLSEVYKDSTDTKINLQFSENFVEITRYGQVETRKEDYQFNYLSSSFATYTKTRKVSWQLSNSHSVIYFPKPIPTVPYGDGQMGRVYFREMLWEITGLKEDQLRLKARWDVTKYPYPHQGSGKQVVLEFKKTSDK